MHDKGDSDLTFEVMNSQSIPPPVVTGMTAEDIIVVHLGQTRAELADSSRAEN